MELVSCAFFDSASTWVNSCVCALLDFKSFKAKLPTALEDDMLVLTMLDGAKSRTVSTVRYVLDFVTFFSNTPKFR